MLLLATQGSLVICCAGVKPVRMAKQPRILALHSFRTSDRIFQDQFLISGLDKALKDVWEPVSFLSANLLAAYPQAPVNDPSC